MPAALELPAAGVVVAVVAFGVGVLVALGVLPAGAGLGVLVV